ncbi:uncharacterized membrane protein C688.16 [Aplysia californica]|uniref:Transmembrane protein 254 n=1 Tax=Aplysia californica TaxID=6500 RepID=A0ABM0K6C4_APLCA|nr:uncharacterized membrane protein C688.16 [Aplysia californica]
MSGRKVSAVKFNPDYFRLPQPLWMISIPFGLWLLAMATVAPNKVPSYLGPFSTLVEYMGKTYPKGCYNVSVFLLAVHSFEAAYAGKLCLDRGLSAGATAKWTASTLLFGVSSLARLWRARPAVKLA